MIVVGGLILCLEQTGRLWPIAEPQRFFDEALFLDDFGFWQAHFSFGSIFESDQVP